MSGLPGTVSQPQFNVDMSDVNFWNKKRPRSCCIAANQNAKRSDRSLFYCRFPQAKVASNRLMYGTNPSPRARKTSV